MTREQQITVVKEMISEAVADGSMTKRCATAIMNAYDTILALPIDVPGDEDVLNYAVDHNRTQKYTTIDYYATGRAEGAKWMRSEILKRNTP